MWVKETGPGDSRRDKMDESHSWEAEQQAAAGDLSTIYGGRSRKLDQNQRTRT